MLKARAYGVKHKTLI